MVVFRSATPADVPAIYGLVQELAAYENLTDQMHMTPDQLHQALFGDPVYAQGMVAEGEAGVVGFALYYWTFSTFAGRPTLYLEDLYVQPAYRGQGIGKGLLSRLVRLALARGCARMEWSVLNWNQPAIDFYRSLGAIPMADWTTYRLTETALHHFPHPPQ
ncbi:MAG: GNAT family N-acetyltransferase [Thermostichales cyanobacterium BF4_bins_65]